MELSAVMLLDADGVVEEVAADAAANAAVAAAADVAGCGCIERMCGPFDGGVEDAGVHVTDVQVGARHMDGVFEVESLHKVGGGFLLFFKDI